MRHVLRALAFCAAITVPPASAAEDAEAAATLLFVEFAPSATMADGTLKLELSDDQIVWFSDRPQRVAGTMTTAVFLELWGEGDDSLQSDPPNAALVGRTDAREAAIVIAISDPRMIEGGVSYDYLVVEGEEHEWWADASLFIDPVHLSGKEFLQASNRVEDMKDNARIRADYTIQTMIGRAEAVPGVNTVTITRN
ncbi:MAG: hypothetical protein AAF968_00760 [Pseudomonadota bacterium]